MTGLRGTHLVSKSLNGVVDNDDFREISAEDAEILNIFPIDTETVLSEETISRRDKRVKVKGRSTFGLFFI